MPRRFLAGIVLGLVLVPLAGAALAQSGGGALRGFVKDESGGVLPGVTVTAISPELIQPSVVVTDETGLYRLNNLPPGDYAIEAELAGFATTRREGILVRAGQTFTVDLQLGLSTLSETITVSGESPMIETSKATTAITLDRELIRAAPVTSRRLFSDALDLAPGIASRNVDDGVGRRAYYFKGAVIFSHVFTLEGAPAGSFLDSSAHSIGFGGDTVQDSELKLAGVDPASPTGTGVVMNIIAPRGGNQFRGAFVYDYQNVDWNADNTKGGSAPGGLPTAQSVKQFDFSVGGPIVRDRVWFFTAFRKADLTNGISRSDFNVQNVQINDPNFKNFDNFMESNQPFVKVTAQLNAKHELTGFYQNDRSRYSSNRELDNRPYLFNSTGGGLYHGRVNSVWTNEMTTSFAVNYNDKRGNDKDTYADLTITGPQRLVHQNAFAQQGTIVGTGSLARMDNPNQIALSDSRMTVIRGDLTYYKTGWKGGHELRAGVWWAPEMIRQTTVQYPNGGFVLQEDRYANGTDPSGGYTTFRQQFRSPDLVPTIRERDKVFAFYVQDAWTPSPRVTINGGVRIDVNRRFDQILDIYRQKATMVQPRVGVSYLITDDARNVVRASYGRLSEQVNGRDYMVTFNTLGAVETTDVYIAPDGTRTSVVTPPTRSLDPNLLFDPDLHQPFVDEMSVGYNRQLRGQMSVGVAFTHRRYQDNFAEYDINGIYPSGPGQPFGGFGLVDPNRGIVTRQTNATWTDVVVNALEATFAKNMSNNFQVIASVFRQWQHISGTWNPTDPARFVQPEAYDNNRDLSQHLFGNGDDNTLNGGGRESGAAYRPFSVRIGGQWNAPWGISVGGSYVIQAGGFTGPLLVRLASNDPQVTQFGPSTVRLANGLTQPNPLATRLRFQGPTRGDGQIRNDDAKYLQLKVGRVFRFGGRSIEPSANIFNVFNTGANTQWNTGANQTYSPNYLGRFNRHPPRSLQLSLALKF
ncbi:MAG: TonB-dependent receptor [Acidobacteriota bacterium]|nr:TonB-dependent receptor [Acidobacteriota bacterium]